MPFNTDLRFWSSRHGSIVTSFFREQENAKAKFDETVEAHIRLGIDPKRGDQVALTPLLYSMWRLVTTRYIVMMMTMYPLSNMMNRKCRK